MKGAIFYSGQYGSTAKYADWIAIATGLPAFDIHDSYADPTKFDFLVLGSSVIVFKLTIRKWVAENLSTLTDKPVLLYTVSGAPPGPKVSKWVEECFPFSFVSRVQHVALQGRLDHSKLPWRMRIFLKIGAMMNKDKQASADERHGFDYMDKSSIKPIVEYVQSLQNNPRPAANAA